MSLHDITRFFGIIIVSESTVPEYKVEVLKMKINPVREKVFKSKQHKTEIRSRKTYANRIPRN
jgi:hypothetical protein